MTDPEQIKEFLSIPRKVFITTHVRPDADAVGSSLALYHYLHAKGHSVTIVFPTEYPYYFKWFPGIKKVKIFKNEEDRIKRRLADADLAFVVDFNDLTRNGDLGLILKDSLVPKVLVDHHPHADLRLFKYKFWDCKAAAAAEKVYDFIKETGGEKFLTENNISSCLYAAIISDTNSFSNSGTSPKSLRIASELMSSGIDCHQIHRLIFDNFTENRLKFFGYCLNQKLEFFYKLHTAVICVTQEDFRNFKLKAGDTELLINQAMMLNEIKISVLITEMEDIIKISMRSKGDIAVNEICSKYFEGGGHINAAGGQLKATIEETKNAVLEKIKDLKISD